MLHYSLGYNEVEHKGKKIRTIVGNTEADNYIVRLNQQPNSAYTSIPNGLEHRPDLLANQVYDDPNKLWLVCLSSNRFDVFEDFDVGAKIKLI